MFWLWIACSVKVPDYLLDPHTFAHPQCSEQDHLRAAGFDEDSSAVFGEPSRIDAAKVAPSLCQRA